MIGTDFTAPHSVDPAHADSPRSCGLISAKPSTDSMGRLPNRLFYGDNLDILRRYIADESIDLVYLDPPFNSQQSYNVLFKHRDGTKAASQLHAFHDTWEWDEQSASTYETLVQSGGDVSLALQAFRQFLNTTDMLAYLTMMAPRLIALRRVLKTTGAIYLHCDPTASHYLKILMDAVFGPDNFKNEISWKRTTTKSDFRQGATNWPRVRDVMLYYAKDARQLSTFNQPFTAYSDAYVQSKYRHVDSDGRHYMLDKLTAPGSGTRGHPKYEFMGVTRYWVYNREKMDAMVKAGRIIQPSPGAVPRYKRYLDEVRGIAVGDSWDDISAINSMALERLGFPTQKPEELLSRIISASSNEGDVVLDPFCGCGTTIASAQRLKRQWIGIDIAEAAIQVIKKRLRDHFDLNIGNVIGEPESVEDAGVLAGTDPYQFQWWALGLVDARPAETRKGADKGIDGRRYFTDPITGKTQQIIFSVKAGHVTVAHIRDLRGVIERERASMGALICMEEATKPMRAEAASAGVVDTAWGKYPRIQIRSINELMAGIRLEAPNPLDVTYKQAPRVVPKVAEQQPEFGSASVSISPFGRA